MGSLILQSRLPPRGRAIHGSSLQFGKQLENPAGDSEKADSEYPPSTGPSNCAHDWNTDAAFVAMNWTRLPDSVRAAIITLVRALL